MKEKKYQFMVLDEYNWDVENKSGRVFDKRNFSQALTDFGLEGWHVVAVNYVKKDKNFYSIITLQRELG